MSLTKTVFIFLLIAIPLSTYAQSHLAVPLENGVYKILENAQDRGILELINQVKPYSKSKIIEYLKEILVKDVLPSEKEIIEKYIYDFSKDDNGEGLNILRWGNYGIKTNKGSFRLGIDLLFDIREDFSHLQDFFTYTRGNMFMAGDIGKHFSYMGKFGGSINRVLEPFINNTYGFYDYTRRWEGERIAFNSKGKDWPDRSVDPKKGFTAYEIKTDLSALLWDNRILIRFAKIERDWGDGNGSLFLDKRAKDFPGLEFTINPVKWFQFSYLFGTLGYREGEPPGFDSSADPNKITYQTMFAMQKVDFMPSKYVYFGITSSIVGPRRFDLGYLSPLISYIIYQTTQIEVDNVVFGGNIGFIVPYIGKLYFEILADEFEVKRGTNFFKHARNMLAYRAGINFPIPKIPFSTFSFQYTKIEPFTYAHYTTRTPTSPYLVDTSYRNGGRNLGYYLKPNSDEFYFSFNSEFKPGLAIGAEYKFIRHGDSFKDGSNFLIHGEIDKYLRYDQPYPEKNFTKDGIYDYTNTCRLYFEYRFNAVPISLVLDYTFSNTFFKDEIGSGIALPASHTVNTIGIYIRVFNAF